MSVIREHKSKFKDNLYTLNSGIKRGGANNRGGGGGLEKQPKVNNREGSNKRGGVKCKHTIFCPRRSAYSLFIFSSRGNNMVVEEREQTTELM